MGLLKNKKILIFGIKNKYSIAYGIAKSLYKQGAQLAFVYHKKKNKKKIENLVKKFNSNVILACNIEFDQDIKYLFQKISKIWKNFDGIVHSVAYGPLLLEKNKENPIIHRKAFLKTYEISSFSLLAITQEAKNFLNLNASIITLTYVGSIRYIPYYNVMGPAKAALESNIRYLSYCMGVKKIRVNAISSGPIKTVSSYKIPYFSKILKFSKELSPLKKNTTAKEVGNVVVFLCSNLSYGITGQVIYVDQGFNVSANLI